MEDIIESGFEASSSLFQSPLSIDKKLDRARQDLLDLGARNRLLNMPRSAKAARIVEIVDELSFEVFRLLVREAKPFSFLPGRASAVGEDDYTEAVAADTVQLAQPDDQGPDDGGVAARHVDTKLQTRLTSKGLQKRLLDIHHDARMIEEEQGANSLFLVLGTLKWLDPNNAANVRFAPLVLVPVRLERATAGERFKLHARQDELSANLSLEAFLDRAHSLKMPIFDGGDDFDPTVYLDAVRDAVSSKAEWTVNSDDIVLGFFSFSKFLMFRDLDPAMWPPAAPIVDRPLITGLLAEGFATPTDMLSDDAPIDPHIPSSELLHIVDSDSSQTLAVHDVRAGRNLVIQGPPGTGKSQTIANIIAAAVADGRTVLFVAEKMTALDVVKRRLDASGVGDACLELHSNKVSKRTVLDELKRTWTLGSPRGQAQDTLVDRLQSRRDDLNGHAERMHHPHDRAGLTPFQVIGHLVRLQGKGAKPIDFRLSRPETWTSDERVQRETLVEELAQRVGDIGVPREHVWWGVGLRSVIPTDVERLVTRIEALHARHDSIVTDQIALAHDLDVAALDDLAAFAPVAQLASRLGGTPSLSGDALGADEWSSDRPTISELIGAGGDLTRIAAAIGAQLQPAAWIAPLSDAVALFAKLPGTFRTEAFETIRWLEGALPRLMAEAEALRTHLGLSAPVDTCAAIALAVTTAERVADAPDASPLAFAATVWDRGVDQAGDLADAVAVLEKAREDVAGRLTDDAWELDLRAVRSALAARGTSLLRHLSGEWRRADRLARSVLVDRRMAVEAVIPLLDSLARGQSAVATLREGDAFGRAAFGEDWRAERSRAAPLQALVAWMRSLRGLGAEPRLIAGRLPDRSQLSGRAAGVGELLAEMRPHLAALKDELVNAARIAFGEAPSYDLAALALVHAWTVQAAASDALCAEIFVDLPDALADRLRLLRNTVAAQIAVRKVEDCSALGAKVFGAAWRGEGSDWPALAAARDWVAANDDIRRLASRLADPRETARKAEALTGKAAILVAEIETLVADLMSDANAVFGAARVENVKSQILAARLQAWQRSGEGLSRWVAFRGRAERARELGLTELVARLETGVLSASEAMTSFQMAYHEALYADQVRHCPELAAFDGELHERLRSDFADLDRQRMATARLEVVTAHHRRIPPQGGMGPVGVLRSEIARRRGNMPIRQLMTKAGPAVQALKPVLMMSPLSVAQFLPPGLLTFDLLVMDEASQIQPVDALGAIARCQRVVVVGDERQLPPTRFFSRMISGAPDDDEDDATRVADIESILGLFLARGLPQRMLRWHYRSRHQSLIAVSNSQFYENKLFIVPSPYTQEAGLGLRFHHVAGGIFDAGGTSANAIEAKTVATAVIRHAKMHAGETLGVATFSAAQRRAIMDELEGLRRLNPDTEPFFHAHPGEPFFVKALENVQGDERDVVMISVGYGRNAQGYMAMRFGPLSADGGERRLNVLISRAKRRCEVYASITDEDIDVERGKGKGVFAFKLFLHFARTGRLAMAQTTMRDMDSPFESQVADALQARGYQVHAQVGIAGFFIDLAIADPERPGRYVLGIECDGASYHASRSARDRDRLRQAVLEDHGWIIHRIWSTDWFQRPREQLERIAMAIEAAKTELDARQERAADLSRAVAAEVVTIDRGEVVEIGLVPSDEALIFTPPYVEAVAEKPSGQHELHEVPTGLLSAVIVKIVVIEGPVHVDEVVARLKTAWGIQRAGSRIRPHVDRCIAAACAGTRLDVSDGFLTIPGAEIQVRDRSDVTSTTLRRPDMLPPREIRAAILDVIRSSLGLSTEEVIQAAARAMGLRTIGPQLRETLRSHIASLEAPGTLLRRHDLLVVQDDPAGQVATGIVVTQSTTPR